MTTREARAAAALAKYHRQREESPDRWREFACRQIWCVGECGATADVSGISPAPSWTCDECRPQRRREALARYQAKQEPRANTLRMNHYGMTVAEYDALVLAQDGRCRGCGEVCDSFHIDHDHNRGCGHAPHKSCARCRRGLLCGPCNRALGSVRDNPETLEALASYLRSHAA